MHNIFKLEYFFLLILIVLFILYLIIGNSFWDFFLVPVGNYGIDFTDLRCVKSWDRLYPSYEDSNFIYNETSACKLNYPKIWIIFSKYLLIDKIFYVYILINFAFYNLIYFYLIKNYKSIFFIYFYLSGASMLMLERGNIEILIFILIFFVFFSKNFIKIVLLCSVISLKIFPFFSIISQLLKYKYVFICCLLFSVTYFFYIYDDLAFIFKNTPSTGDMSYGTKSISSNLVKHFDININNYLISIAFIILILFFYLTHFKNYLKNVKYNHEEMFLSGGTIYSATFLINSNHDYRMIFLLLIIPLILQLNKKILKFTFLTTIILCLELNRLLFFFGFFGGIINTFFKIILFFLVTLTLIDILLKKIITKNTLKNII